MGNFCCSGVSGHRRHGSQQTHQPAPPQPEITANRYVVAAATPHPSQYPANRNASPPPSYYENPGYYPPPPRTMPLSSPYDHRHPVDPSHWVADRYPRRPTMPPPPYVEHQGASKIVNDVNLKKETLRLEQDEENLGQFLVAFTFDANVAGSITVIFFAKEGEDCVLTPMKDNLLPPVTVNFQQGLGQKFRQPSGSGIDFSMFVERELLNEGEMDVYPLAVKAEACPINQDRSDGDQTPRMTNSLITQAVFEKDKGEYQVRVMKQILLVNGMMYKLQEIYGIENSVDGDVDTNDLGKECGICLSEPSDTAVLPCRHLCMCSGCAKALWFQSNHCPICRQPMERLLEIKVNSEPDE